MSSNTPFEVVIDGHKLLYTDVWLLDLKDDLLLTKVSDRLRDITACRHFSPVRWADIHNTDVKTWCRLIVEFDSQENAVLWQLKWG